MNLDVNETIIKMVRDLKSGGNKPESSKNQFNTSLKRSLSSTSNESSFDEPTPIKRLKRENKLDMSYLGSPREMRRLRADLIEARNTILTLENSISRMHNVRKEMQLMFDEETKTLRRQHENDTKSIEELEKQLQSVRKREADIKQELVELKTNYDLLKIKNDEHVEQLEKDMNDIKEESRNFELQDDIESSALRRKIAELETILQAAEEDAEAQKKLATELAKELSEKNAVERNLELKDLALQKARLQIKELEYAKENFLEFQEQAKTQAHKLARYVELEKENEFLKEENTRIKEEMGSKLLLEEEVFDLKSRNAKYKEMEKKYSDLQVQDVQNQMYLNEYRAVARGICESTQNDSALPHLLRSAVERLQQQELVLTSEKVELESQLKTASHAAKVAKAELEKNVKLLNELKQTGEQKQNLIHRMQKKLMLVSRERDSYRLQLDSYEKDLTMVVNTSTTSGPGAGIIHSQKERIENLERIVEGYRDMVSKLENDLQTALPNAHSDVVPVRAEQMTRLQDEVDRLRSENEKLQEQRDRLEIQLEQFSIGQDTLQGGQVFHLANNPLAECLAQRENLVEQLEQEVARLKNKIKKLEEGIDTSKIGDITISPKEVEMMKEQIKSHEAQTQRLKEYFKSSMQEFRNVIYMLLGYKIDRTSNSLYKIRSMYAEHPDDQLCFQVNQDGDLDLLENDFSATLEVMIDLHLRHQKSIPVFLSAITMDLFQNKTMTKTFS